ncbi:hypothetical protein ACJX0J_030450, partial [Zea mays]
MNVIWHYYYTKLETRIKKTIDLVQGQFRLLMLHASKFLAYWDYSLVMIGFQVGAIDKPLKYTALTYILYIIIWHIWSNYAPITLDDCYHLNNLEFMEFIDIVVRGSCAHFPRKIREEQLYVFLGVVRMLIYIS